MFCSICKKEIDKYDFTGIFGTEISPSYGSKFDGENIIVHCCAACTDKLITNEIELNGGHNGKEEKQNRNDG